jgi:hypothetical protein
MPIVTTLRRLIALAAVVVGVLGGAGSASADAGFESRVLELVNQERAAHGLAPLAASSELQSAARGYAGAMAGGGFFAHNGPDGSTPASRVEAAGYRGWSWVAENIAAGQRSPEQVMTSWMNSPGHRQNLLSPSAREIGIGHVEQGGTKYGHYWVQNFGARANAPMASRDVRTSAPATSAPGCRFQLGFAALRGAIPGVVGGCTEDEHHNPANGDALQKTTGGLLVWRKSDNFTAFTDGHRSWVAGPFGVQSRLNSERFAWEK